MISHHHNFINLLRAFSAWAVFYYHFVIHTLYSYPKLNLPFDSLLVNAVFRYFDLGRFAVSIFFIISGYLVPSTIHNHGNYIYSYLLRRAFRIYPAYFITLLILILQLVWQSGLDLEVCKLYLANLTFFPSLFGYRALSGVFWTLQIEVLLYLMALFLHCFNLRYFHQLNILLLLLVCYLLLLRVQGAAATSPVMPFIAAAFFVYGDLLRSTENKFSSFNKLASILFVQVLFIFLIAKLQWQSDWFRHFTGMSAALIAFYLCWSFSSLLSSSNRLVGFISLNSKVSYGIYLLHGIFGLSAASYLINLGINPFLSFLIAGIITLVASCFLYTLIEKPFIELAKKFF